MYLHHVGLQKLHSRSLVSTLLSSSTEYTPHTSRPSPPHREGDAVTGVEGEFLPATGGVAVLLRGKMPKRCPKKEAFRLVTFLRWGRREEGGREGGRREGGREGGGREGGWERSRLGPEFPLRRSSYWGRVCWASRGPDSPSESREERVWHLGGGM